MNIRVFPTKALDPDGKLRSILVDSTGALVTTQAPVPAVVYHIDKKSVALTADGKIRIAQ